MQYTNEKIEKLQDFYNKLEEIKTELNSEYVNAKEGASEKVHKLTRNDKEVEVSEDMLWYEVENLGSNCEAGTILQPKYPKVFELSKQYDETVHAMNAFSIKELGVDPLKVSLIDIIRIAMAVKEM